MRTQRQYQQIFEQLAALRELVVVEAGDMARDPAFAGALKRNFDEML